MWYFTWILGLGVAVMFAVINAMWLESREDERRRLDNGHDERPGER
ncbi:MAG: cytochrome bd-I oxidase subunit CydX [Neomegalonema sp.]|nr:cytochrome bd-I oxidase subunit CydX [Neomegalonema sp.]